MANLERTGDVEAGMVRCAQRKENTETYAELSVYSFFNTQCVFI